MRFVGIACVHAWRQTVGRLTPPNTCKYHPSCSEYALEAFRQRGLLVGGALTAWRLLRCNPWSHGGVDYVPKKRCTHEERPA